MLYGCRLELNLTFFAVVAYSLYYLVLEPVAGLSWSACVGLPLWLTATTFQHSVAKAGLWALGVHVFSWYMQVGATDASDANGFLVYLQRDTVGGASVA